MVDFIMRSESVMLTLSTSSAAETAFYRGLKANDFG